MSRKRRAESLSEEDDDEETSESLSSDSEVSSEDEDVNNEEEEGEEVEEEIVNCDFEFFDPQKQDFLGVKHLLRQLFDNDADSFDLGALAELILAQPLVGTTVKTEGHESDPLSFLTVLNLRVHKNNPVVSELSNYFVNVSEPNKGFQSELAEFLNDFPNGDIGLVLSERIVNMPDAVAPPSYKMLLEEIQWANEDKEPYDFSYYLILSRTYVQNETGTDEEDDASKSIKPRPNIKKRKYSLPEDEMRYFHPEDELFSRSSPHVIFPFKAGEDMEEGHLKTFGLLVMVGKSQFESAVREMADFIGGRS